MRCGVCGYDAIAKRILRDFSKPAFWLISSIASGLKSFCASLAKTTSSLSAVAEDWTAAAPACGVAPTMSTWDCSGMISLNLPCCRPARHTQSALDRLDDQRIDFHPRVNLPQFIIKIRAH